MIGLSVSFCIKQMARGEADPASVEMIVAGIRAPTREDLEMVVKSYRKSYWKGIEERAEALFWKFWAEEKIFQPRLKDGWIPSLSNGIWVNSFEEIVQVPYSL